LVGGTNNGLSLFAKGTNGSPDGLAGPATGICSTFSFLSFSFFGTKGSVDERSVFNSLTAVFADIAFKKALGFGAAGGGLLEFAILSSLMFSFVFDLASLKFIVDGLGIVRGVVLIESLNIIVGVQNFESFVSSSLSLSLSVAAATTFANGLLLGTVGVRFVPFTFTFTFAGVSFVTGVVNLFLFCVVLVSSFSVSDDLNG